MNNIKRAIDEKITLYYIATISQLYNKAVNNSYERIVGKLDMYYIAYV